MFDKIQVVWKPCNEEFVVPLIIKTEPASGGKISMSVMGGIVPCYVSPHVLVVEAYRHAEWMEPGSSWRSAIPS